MAHYTITISDTEGGVLFGMKGPQLHDSEASKLAMPSWRPRSPLAGNSPS